MSPPLRAAVLPWLAALVGCAPEYGLSDATPLPATADLGDGAAFAAFEAPIVAVATPGAPAPPTTPASASPAGAAPSTAIGALAGRLREEQFALGPSPTPVADFLFVIDDSISMRKVMDQLHAGLGTLLEPGTFPSGSRIAVLYTTPGDPDDLSQPHPLMRPVGADDLSPGFLGLVDASRIARYVATAPRKYAARFPLTGCDAWFTPESTNAEGVPCLAAHTVPPLLPFRAEAGLVALRQWLEATDGTPRFRAGAAVNVIFLSDTHDPGIAPKKRASIGPEYDELVAERPDFSELEALVDEPVAAFRVHAIAPASQCGEAWDEATYFDVAKDAGGVVADICTTEDYGALIAQIAHSGSVRQSPVLRLGYPATRVESVRVDGAPASWSPTGDAQAIRLDGALPTAMETVRVRYRRE